MSVALSAVSTVRAGESAAPYRFPNPGSAFVVAVECQLMLADLKQAEARLAQGTEPPGPALLAELDAMTRRTEDTLGPLAVLVAVSPRKAIRDAGEACDRDYQAYASHFQQNAAVYARLQQVQPADDIDRRFLRDTLDAFEDSGVALPVDRQQRVREINDELTALTQTFERRIREDRTQLFFTRAELAGAPTGVWQRAPRDARGRYRLGLEQATVFPLLENATVPATRERMWRAFQSLGGVENIETLAVLTQRRRELALLFGHASYADFVLRRRMAHSEAEVQAFLSTVKDAVQSRELTDLAELRAEKAAHLKQNLDTTVLDRWDTSFYAERVRRARYAVDQEQFRRYFPPGASLRFVFRLAERLFGVTFTPVAVSARQPLWHPDARTYTVTDRETQAHLGTLFVDLYPRADKFNHAAVWSLRNASGLADRRPAAALVVNFNRQGLTLDELETLLHEFGHALHSLLSKTRYAAQGGTSVQLDFVEAPSQMLEDWVYDPQVLRLFAEVCRQCKPVPPALLAQARAARDFGKGIQFSRQHLFASYDLALHGREPAEPLALWAQMEGATPLGHVSGSMFPAGFEHIAGGYAAGYYGYLWSLVLAEDLRTAFVADRLDARVGRRYRETVLANGGQVAPAELMQRFLGRATDRRAFFNAIEK
ncbi:MAG: M3 family metallopeptidase [Burkholderiaceae bacterium]|nr:M3 family metallopeptidase [Burkholderiaceae bacterium]